MMIPMSEENQKPQKDPRQSGGNDPQINWRGVVLFAVFLALIGGAFLFRSGNFNQTDDISNAKFLELLKAGEIINTQEKPLQIIAEGGRATNTFSGYYRHKSATGTDVDTAFRTQ